jgi:hypothetical protein
MKPYTKFVLIVFVIVMFGLPMIMKGPDGRPIMTIDDWLPSGSSVDNVVSTLNSVKDSAMQVVSEHSPSDDVSEDELMPVQAGAGTMYKWQDEKGRWHFSNEKPQAASQVSVEALPEVKNLMQAPVVKDRSSSNIGAASGSTQPAAGLPIPGLSVSKDQASEMMRQLDQITKAAEQRKAFMDQ